MKNKKLLFALLIISSACSLSAMNIRFDHHNDIFNRPLHRELEIRVLPDSSNKNIGDALVNHLLAKKQHERDEYRPFNFQSNSDQ